MDIFTAERCKSQAKRIHLKHIGTMEKPKIMSKIENLKNLNLPEDTVVTLTMEEGTDVFHFNETEIETALADTSVVGSLSDLMTTPGLNLLQHGNSLLDGFRSEGLLDDYERGSLTFSEYIAESINDDFYDVDCIEYSTEKYDHKRGFTTLTAEVQVNLGELLEHSPYLGGWEVKVPTPNGTLTLED